MEGGGSTNAAHQQWRNSLRGGKGFATTPVMVMEMVGIFDKASKVAERLIDSGRYDETLEAY